MVLNLFQGSTNLTMWVARFRKSAVAEKSEMNIEMVMKMK
jgi:hypothetical protein